jgi:hypothetical protein
VIVRILGRLLGNAAGAAGCGEQDFVEGEHIMVNRPRGDNEAQMDELENRPGETGAESAGQSGDTQQLSAIEDATDESVEELNDEEQSIEAATVEGVEDAADHPERPVHTHLEYGRPEDQPPVRKAS